MDLLQKFTGHTRCCDATYFATIMECGQYIFCNRSPKNRKPPSQTWRTFLNNHFREMASIDFLTVSTETFRMLYVLVVLAHDRRRVASFYTPGLEISSLP